MMRLVGCAVLGLLLCAGTRLATAQDTKKSDKSTKTATKSEGKTDEHGGKGRIKKVDLEKHVITVTMTASGKDHDFMVDDSTKIISTRGQQLKVGLKSKQLKAGASVTVKAGDDGKATEITLNRQPPSPTADK
jgi:hypothetical protein